MYILYEGKQDYVCIEKEVQFIDKYLNLNKLFIQDKSAVVVDKSELDIDSIYYKKKMTKKWWGVRGRASHRSHAGG